MNCNVLKVTSQDCPKELPGAVFLYPVPSLNKSYRQPVIVVVKHFEYLLGRGKFTAMESGIQQERAFMTLVREPE